MAEALGITVSALAWNAEDQVLVANLLAARARLAPHAHQLRADEPPPE